MREVRGVSDVRMSPATGALLRSPLIEADAVVFGGWIGGGAVEVLEEGGGGGGGGGSGG